jgi:hypothetical protein
MNAQPDSLEPILCAHLLRRVDEKLIDLLRSLEPSDLLDMPLRKLSMVRDSNYLEPVATHSHQDVVALVNRLNQEGVTVYRR